MADSDIEMEVVAGDPWAESPVDCDPWAESPVAGEPWAETSAASEKWVDWSSWASPSSTWPGDDSALLQATTELVQTVCYLHRPEWHPFLRD